VASLVSGPRYVRRRRSEYDRARADVTLSFEAQTKRGADLAHKTIKVWPALWTVTRGVKVEGVLSLRALVFPDGNVHLTDTAYHEAFRRVPTAPPLLP